MPPCNRQRPSDWKTSYVTAVPKTPSPDILDETRPVPITPMPSFLCESFVSEWAYADLHPNFDQQQDGNIRSTSTSHYLISLVDYIYTNLEKRETSVVATRIYFSQAFDLADQTTIRKASAMGLRVPWRGSQPSSGAPPGSPPAGCHVLLSASDMRGAPGHQNRPFVLLSSDK